MLSKNTRSQNYVYGMIPILKINPMYLIYKKYFKL